MVGIWKLIIMPKSKKVKNRTLGNPYDRMDEEGGSEVKKGETSLAAIKKRQSAEKKKLKKENMEAKKKMTKKDKKERHTVNKKSKQSLLELDKRHKKEEREFKAAKLEKESNVIVEDNAVGLPQDIDFKF